MISKLVLGAVLAPVLCSSTQSSLNLGHFERYVPVTMTEPASATAGTTINITVTLQGAPTEDEVVTIAASQQGMFSNLPTSVVVPAGHQTWTFQATLATSASGSVSVVASAVGGYATGSTSILPGGVGDAGP